MTRMCSPRPVTASVGRHDKKRGELAMTIRIVILLVFAWLLSVAAHAQTPNLEGVKWQEGPSIGSLSSTAEVHIPAGYVFAGANDTYTDPLEE